MMTLKIHEEGEDTLVYFFQDESYGKHGNLGKGITTFVSAMRKQYKDFPLKVTLTIMNDRGEYYNHTTNKYNVAVEWKDCRLLLSAGRT